MMRTKNITYIKIQYKIRSDVKESEIAIYHNSRWFLINIHELSYKCKEYLLDEGYYIVIHPFQVELFEKDTNKLIRAFHYPIQSKSIPYDVSREIQACQWIYDEVNK